VITSIGAIVVDGRVYPSVTPPSEPSAPTTPLSEPMEQKQLNACAMNIGMENSSVAQALSLVPNQTSSNIPHNAYINQPMNIPITSHQQLSMQTQQQMANQQQMQAQTQNYMQHYNAHNMQQRSSPQNQRIATFNVNYNGHMQQQQQQQMMMAQRPGLGNCHQQVHWQ
jgi:tripartite motif-containing protein 33